MRPLLLTLAILLLASPAFAKQKKADQIHDPAPLRYGMELAEADKVVGDQAMWHTAYRVDTATTSEFAAVWSGEVFYHLRFLDGKCCYIEKRAEVEPEAVDQLIQMYRGVYGDSPEATSSRDGRLIFSRWQVPNREITINAVGRNGKYKLFYEEFDPVSVGDVRVAQEKELGDQAETDPLTGKLRINPMGQAASTADDAREDPKPAADSAGDEAAPVQDKDDDAAPKDDAPKDGAKPKKEKRRQEHKDDPVTGDRG
jgi:hypothetical protein